MAINSQNVPSSALFSEEELNAEAARLYENLKNLQWSLDVCRDIADLTLEINRLKKENEQLYSLLGRATAELKRPKG